MLMKLTVFTVLRFLQGGAPFSGLAWPPMLALRASNVRACGRAGAPARALLQGAGQGPPTPPASPSRLARVAGGLAGERAHRPRASARRQARLRRPNLLLKPPLRQSNGL